MPRKKEEYFGKVKEARQALASKSLELFEMYVQLIRDALAAQEFKTAQKGIQFLMEHLPKDVDGVSFLDTHIDKKVEKDKGSSTPTIQIGIALGGQTQKALPQADVIDVEPNE